MKRELIPTTIDHIVNLARNMRQADIDEVWASSALEPIDALLFSFERTENTKTGVINGEIACIVGVTPFSLMSGHGCPWLLTSTAVDYHPLAFARGCRHFFEEVTEGYTYLVNFVDDRHVDAQQWLAWLGFTLHDPAPFGPFNMNFRKFEMRK